jgi:hypothetical protein
MAVKVVQGLIDATPAAAGVAGASSAVATVSAHRHQVSAAAQIATHHYSHAEAAVQRLRNQSADRKRQRITTEAEAFGIVEQLALSLLSEDEGAREAHSQLSPDTARYFLT